MIKGKNFRFPIWSPSLVWVQHFICTLSSTCISDAVGLPLWCLLLYERVFFACWSSVCYSLNSFMQGHKCIFSLINSTQVGLTLNLYLLVWPHTVGLFLGLLFWTCANCIKTQSPALFLWPPWLCGLPIQYWIKSVAVVGTDRMKLLVV